MQPSEAQRRALALWTNRKIAETIRMIAPFDRHCIGAPTATIAWSNYDQMRLRHENPGLLAVILPTSSVVFEAGQGFPRRKHRFLDDILAFRIA